MLAPLLKLAFSKHLKSTAQSAGQPEFAQQNTFARLLRELRPAQVAKHLCFTELKSLSDLKHLALQSEETYADYFAEFFARGDDPRNPMFCASPIVAIGRTSGTTGHAKYIPLSEELLRSFDRTLLRQVACLLDSENLWSNYFRGKKILLNARPFIETAPCGIPVCDISGLLPTRTFKALRNGYLPSYEMLGEPDWRKKVDHILRAAKGANVTAIAGIPAVIDQFLSEARLKFRFRYLDELWPELQTIVYGSCHLDSTQRQNFSTKWLSSGRRFHFAETYLATEGAFGFSATAASTSLTFNLLENIYLFKPLDNPHDLKFAHEVNPGETYSLVVTTPGGLINYQMGDIVRISSINPLSFQVVGREVDELSMTGERISLTQLDLTLKRLGLTFDLHRPIHWVETGDNDMRPDMQLVWGLPETAAAKELVRNPARFDEILCSHNVLYKEALEVEKILRPSRVEIISSQVFDHHLQKSFGRGQYKQKRVFKTPQELKEFLQVPSGSSEA